MHNLAKEGFPGAFLKGGGGSGSPKRQVGRNSQNDKQNKSGVCVQGP